jgi:hypothetical protein
MIHHYTSDAMISNQFSTFSFGSLRVFITRGRFTTAWLVRYNGYGDFDGRENPLPAVLVSSENSTI